MSLCKWPVLALILTCSANAQDRFVIAGFNDNRVYRVGSDGSYSVIAEITGTPQLSGVATIDQNNVAVVGFQSDTIYRVNMDGSYATFKTIPNRPGLDGIASFNQTKFVTVGHLDNNVYLVDSEGPHIITHIADPAGLSGVAIVDQNSIVTVGNTNNTIYRVQLNGSYSVIGSITDPTPTMASTPELSNIAVLNPNQFVTVGFEDDKVYQIDSTDIHSMVIKVPIDPGLNGIALLDQNDIVAVGFQDNSIYKIALDRSYLKIATIPYNAGLSGIAILPSIIPSNNLTGNNAALANYFNTYAPVATLNYLTSQTDIGHALKQVSPARNAFCTFASQESQLLLSQQLYDHLDQTRNVRNWPAAELAMISKSDPITENNNDLYESENISKSTPPMQIKKNKHIPWLGLFGDYTRVGAQNQTPTFRTGVGGFIIACDHQLHSKKSLIGSGAAYARTQLNETRGMGKAHIDQGALVFYGSFKACDWHFDLAAWGGYYHAHNLRKISFPGFHGSVRSQIHGWQLTPHLEIGYNSITPTSWDWFALEPFGMVDWVNNWEHGFKEKGTGIFDFKERGKWCSYLRSEIGLRFVQMLHYHWGNLIFREKGSYAYQKAFHTGSVTAALIGSPGFVNLITFKNAQNLGVGALELIFLPQNKNYPQLSLAYQGQFGNKYQSHEVIATLAMNF